MKGGKGEWKSLVRSTKAPWKRKRQKGGWKEGTSLLVCHCQAVFTVDGYERHINLAKNRRKGVKTHQWDKVLIVYPRMHLNLHIHSKLAYVWAFLLCVPPWAQRFHCAIARRSRGTQGSQVQRRISLWGQLFAKKMATIQSVNTFSSCPFKLDKMVKWTQRYKCRIHVTYEYQTVNV